MEIKKIFALDTDETANESTLYIYDDIYSGSGIAEAIRKCGSSKINVRINSYGGEVGEGLAIYNALKESKAEIVTYCDSMACSIASVIFMAGSKRIISKYGYLMIHNAWSGLCGNANELRKAADDLEKFTNASVDAYSSATGISKEEIQAMLDNETVLDSDEAIEKGFATEKASDDENEDTNASQSARKVILSKIKQQENTENKEVNEAKVGRFKVTKSGDGLNIVPIKEDESNDDSDLDDDADEMAAQRMNAFLEKLL